jgi:sulfur-carrier protein
VPKVYIPALLRQVTGGRAEVEVEGANVRQIIANLEAQYPGFGERLIDQGRLRPNISVAIDDEVAPLGLMEPVPPGSEVYFLTAIRGGCKSAL